MPRSKGWFRALAVLEVPMRARFAILLAATLPMMVNPLQAAQSRHHKVMKHVPKGTETVDAVPEQKSDEGIILLQPSDIPNPYKNPQPRMISDAWAVRT